MMQIQSLPMLTRNLAGAIALLLAVLALQLALPPRLDDVPRDASTGPELPEVGVPAPFVPPALEQFGQILERPLLFPERRLPAPPAVDAMPVAPKEPLHLKLEGVALAGDARVALLRDQKDNTLLHIAEGMLHNGWTLESVQSNKAIFSRAGESTELLLEIQSGRGRR